jgi:hypothetical protein
MKTRKTVIGMPKRVAQKPKDPLASHSGSTRVRFSQYFFGAPGKLENTQIGAWRNNTLVFSRKPT